MPKGCSGCVFAGRALGLGFGHVWLHSYGRWVLRVPGWVATVVQAEVCYGGWVAFVGRVGGAHRRGLAILAEGVARVMGGWFVVLMGWGTPG